MLNEGFDAVPDFDDNRLLSFAVSAAYPNPFNSSTTVIFSLPRAGRVDLSLYDIMGRRVRDLTPQGWFDAGKHRMLIDAEGLQLEGTVSNFVRES